MSNCLAAAAAGLVLGIDLPTIVRGLEQVETIPGRLERIECGQPFGVFVDESHTPDALKASLRALRQVTEGRLICVYGADAERDPAMRPLVGHVVERGADVSVITSDNPRSDEPLQIAHDILDGYDKASRAQIMPDRFKAIQWALEQAGTGDTVVIAGKGDRQVQVIDGTKYHFDDCEVARNWLYEVGANVDYSPAAQPTHLKIFNPIA
ncbi:MAG: cyanophycin synthetase [Pirellulaceae bacterium]|nr:cyanophycin synthetase [Pirellulaceae bacterium]